MALRHLRLPALTVAACALLAAGCAQLPSAANTAAVARQAHAHFDLEGRISATDGERAASGQIEWRHTPSTDLWTAFSPLGQIVARLDSHDGGAELVLSDGTRRRASHADRLLPALIGVDVPLTRLPVWVQAAPRHDAEVRTLDPYGRPALVIDQGWRIDYTEYADTTAGALPRRIEISRGDARIKIVIDQWTLQP
ncbi:outer membrane lipoprotein LolB [Azoarcus sp. L1K30]|nr:outer membrane lipoprotein LolB [Azoarcus sp. L1K30]